MATISYLAKEREGKTVSGTIEAKSKTEALSLLNEKGLTPIKVEEKASGLSFKMDVKIGKSKIKAQDKIAFIRQLSILINAGIPLAQAFSILSRQATNETFQEIIQSIEKDLQGGISLSNALGKYPKVFDAVFINMIKAGEVSGSLDKTLDRLATQTEKDAEIVSKVKGALTYPMVILSAAVIAVIFLMIKVVPQISSVFSEMGGELPINTRILIASSNILRKYFIIVALVITGAIFGIRYIFKTQPKAKYLFGKLLTKLPLVKTIIVKLNTARFTRTLGTLLASGLPVIDALEVASDSLSSDIFKEKLSESKQLIKNGQHLSVAIAQTNLFPPIVTEMITVGEETGSLETILEKLADFHDRELDNLIASLSSVLEPLIMILLGLIIGFIVVSILQPIYSMSELI